MTGLSMESRYYLKKKLIVCTVLAITLLVGISGPGVFVARENPAQAARPENTEKLRIDGIRWDRASQSFIIDLSCNLGIAKDGDEADFLVSTELWIDTGEQLSIVRAQEDTVTKIEGAAKDGNRVQIAPQVIPWGRRLDSGKLFTGNAWVTTKVVLKNPSYGTVGNVVSEFGTIKITAP
jgi:hypothetical protein